MTSDVPAATAGATPNAMRSTGTMTKPPPSPTSEPKMLAATPMRNSAAMLEAVTGQGARTPRALALHAPDVPPVARVDANHVARVDEQRYVHGRAGLELRGLGGAGGRIALEPGIGLLDAELDVRRKVRADRRAVVELHGDPHAVLEEVGRVADDLALQRDVLVRLVVHEMVAVGVVVQHLHVAVVDGRALELLARAERALHRRAALDVLQARPHERRAFAR